MTPLISQIFVIFHLDCSICEFFKFDLIRDILGNKRLGVITLQEYFKDLVFHKTVQSVFFNLAKASKSVQFVFFSSKVLLPPSIFTSNLPPLLCMMMVIMAMMTMMMKIVIMFVIKNMSKPNKKIMRLLMILAKLWWAFGPNNKVQSKY